MYTSTVVAQREEAKTLPDGTYMEVDAKLYSLGEQEPYFSTTATLWQSKNTAEGSRADRYCLGSGAMTDEISRHFPKLRPVVALHLSDEHGRPLHAVANGWYWYSDYDGKGTNANNADTPLDRARQYLRAPDLPEGLDRESFTEWVETHLPERWQREADEALAVLRD